MNNEQYKQQKEKYDLVKKLKSEGMLVKDIVTFTGLTRSCVNNWVNRKRTSYENGYTKIHKNYIKIYANQNILVNPLEFLEKTIPK